VIELRTEAMKAGGRKLLLNAFQFDFIRRCNRVPKYRCELNLSSNYSKYNVNIHSRDDKLKRTLRTTPSQLNTVVGRKKLKVIPVRGGAVIEVSSFQGTQYIRRLPPIA
jgi:hypothetical protein